MNLADVRAFAERHTTKSVYRQEVLAQYAVDSDQDNVERYLSGGDGPTWAQGNDWMDYLVEERAAGIRRHRVHLLASPLSPYLRYECEWGYAYTSRYGEEIHILDTTETPRPAGLIDEDFWLYDDRHVVLMRYDPEGRFTDAEALPETEAPRYRGYRDIALAAAVPFAAYWQRHPEEWRENWLHRDVRPGGRGEQLL